MSNYRRTFLQRTALVGSGLIGAATGVGAADTDSTGATGSARIEGTVTHFGRPVADATVTADENSTRTDESGSYSLEIDRGEYTLSVTAPGYASRSIAVNVADGETVSMDVGLEREWGPGSGDLEVSATPVGGGRTIPCEITVFGDERYGVTAPLGSAPDGENWEKGFQVSEGWWEILVTNAEGYSDGYQEVLVEDGETAFGWVQLAEGDDEIAETGRIDGTVVDETGTPVDGATVWTDGARTAVDDDGEFELELEHGRHRIVTTAAGYERVAGDVQVKFGRTTGLTVTLRSRDSQ
ncbi:carboxypeptidase-like regulatory domain-containing protein [Natrinema amylolyticum]|uniref:carboxypeptidase-like regulatory domain-containing protein n=1 Tax=Natrinema amylolyticum TaxID=2878679 RepID=UPI001CFAFB6A|nr:carboxypeptidase-like regulatory domain-containing protein [Natrinema amylolyticum]